MASTIDTNIALLQPWAYQQLVTPNEISELARLAAQFDAVLTRIHRRVYESTKRLDLRPTHIKNE